MLTAQDGGYTHVLVVKDKQAASDPLLGQLNYRLSSPDLTFHLDDASRSVSAQDAKGEEVAGSPTPFMWDSAYKVAVTEGEPVPAAAPEAKDHPTLALPGLNGAEGNHAKAATAALSAENILTVTPNSKLLEDADTVYPVFIDPSFKGHKQNWTTFYKTEGSSSFWNGQNYNSGSGTPEARVGYESTAAWHLPRRVHLRLRHRAARRADPLREPAHAADLLLGLHRESPRRLPRPADQQLQHLEQHRQRRFLEQPHHRRVHRLRLQQLLPRRVGRHRHQVEGRRGRPRRLAEPDPGPALPERERRQLLEEVPGQR